jgi:hypothetical protein
MSEYMERHTVSRLIGAPPGYVGFDQGGLLTDGVDQHPYCVLLLDEIEKAHPDLFNILLQVMDHGSLTDHNGKKIDFRNVILIMTTNAGASDMAKAAIGFGSSKREGDDMEAINRLFTPEFRNRLDAIIPFGSLPVVIHMVVQKFVMQLEAQLAERNVTFDLGEDAVAWLADKGYDERMGARPLGRVIQENIKKELANELLFGKLKQGGTVKVTVGDKDNGTKGTDPRGDFGRNAGQAEEGKGSCQEARSGQGESQDEGRDSEDHAQAVWRQGTFQIRQAGSRSLCKERGTQGGSRRKDRATQAFQCRTQGAAQEVAPQGKRDNQKHPGHSGVFCFPVSALRKMHRLHA